MNIDTNISQLTIKYGILVTQYAYLSYTAIIHIYILVAKIIVLSTLSHVTKYQSHMTKTDLSLNLLPQS